MDLCDPISNDANTLESRSVPFDIDLNETPLSSPRETVTGNDVAPPGFAKGKGKAVVLDLDINALPSEDQGEDILGLVNFGRRSTQGASAVHNSTNAPVTSCNFLFGGNPFGLRGIPANVPCIVKPSFVDNVHPRGNFLRNVKGRDAHSLFRGGNIVSDYSVNTISFQNQSEKLLENLRKFVLDNHGILLEDGWSVEFFYCQNRCKICAVYCSPNGNKFESMFDVACHLKLVSSRQSLGTRDRNGGFPLAQSRFFLDGRKQESLIFSRTKDFNGWLENLESNFGVKVSLGTENRDVDGCMSGSNNSEPTSIDDSSHYKDGFPVQFADFFVLSLGEVDPRPCYHCASQIWPVGYKSSWHDKITGSFFVCDVADGGDHGPVFKVQRYPCATRSIPTGSTILSRPSISTDNKKPESTFDINYYEDINAKMIFSDDIPSHLDFTVMEGGTASTEVFNFQPTDGLQKHSHCASKNLQKPLCNSIRLGDDIGEFLVEGKSSCSVWKMVSEKLVHTFSEMYKQNYACEFSCRHAYQWCSSCIIYDSVETAESTDSLSKFCHMSGPFDVPRRVESNDELSRNCESLVKWLGQDRFGLDVDFVQELIERLPGAHSFSDYIVLNSRTDKSKLQTVGNGFLMEKRGNDSQGEKDINCKAPKKTLVKGVTPPGKPLGAKLPPALVGDVLQSWELLWRFSEVLGLEQTLSFEELEEKLIDSDSFNLKSSYTSSFSGTKQDTSIATEMETLEEGTTTRQASTNTSCGGETLYKAHCSLLKVLLGELQSELTVSEDLRLESGESKSKKRKKKEADNLTLSVKPMLDLVPINELTWPELARRYFLIISSREVNLDSPEAASHVSSKVFYCLQGDSGALYGPLPGVAVMEADELLLAEATKQIFGSLLCINDNLNMELNESGLSKEVNVDDAEVPKWAKALYDVKTLPTNVGAKIRNCVYEALALDPPDWAVEILEHSISKGVYKGNASGPTKREVISLLEKVCGVTQQPKTVKKRKSKRVTLSDIITRQCRKVLRCAAAEDEEKVFCNLLGRTLLNTSDNDDEGLLGFPAMVSRPLDFRTIDLRLAYGTYEGSHEAFVEDVREVWNHIRIAHRNQADLVDLADTLSQKFEILYEKEVLTLVEQLKGYTGAECLSPEIKSKIESLFAQGSATPRAPWEERVCKVCGLDKDDDNVLLCDKCDSGYHTYCLNPPLAGVPDGNWYCPSCESSSKNDLEISDQYRKRRRPGEEFTYELLESLAQLIRAMELKDYWEYSVDERICLLKLLGDEVLNSSSIRENLDQCASASSDLQQKLRSLSTEWRNLKLREEFLAEKVVKANTGVLNNNAGISRIGASSVNLEDDLLFPRTNELNESCCFYRKSGAEQHSTSNGSQVVKISDSEFQGNQSDVTELQSDNQEYILVKNRISVLQESIASLELQSLKVSLRKDLLGKDSSGRLYWIFSRPGSSPSVIVDAALTNSIEYLGQFLSNNPMLRFSPMDNILGNVSEITKGIPVASQIYFHQSSAEIEELIKWLRNSDPTQKELIESLTYWLSYSRNNQPISAPLTVEKNSMLNSLKTRALMALEKYYGPCLELDVTISVEWRKKEVPFFGERMWRCKCLEPIWPSRHHCQSCHWSFSAWHEINEHNDVKCSSDPYSGKKVIDDVLKGKGVTRNEQRATSNKTKKCNSDNARHKIQHALVGSSNNMTSPFNFDEICAKFVTKNSNKELVKEIGLLGSNGFPSFVPSASHYLTDPALKLNALGKDDVSQTDRSGDNLSQSAEQKGTVTRKRHVNRSKSNKNCPALDVYKELEEIARSSDQSWLRPSYSRPGNDVSVIRDFSFRPLVGRGTQILRQLKICLLDMDAALPEEAIKSSRANTERRCTWRAFIKSAKSVFEMVQATIVFENMIKTEYLRNEWWYWSSISAAAKIATISSLALRVYTLDAAIIYEKPCPVCREEIGEVDNKSDDSSSAHTDATILKPYNKPSPKSRNAGPADNGKAQGRSGKKRKYSGC